MYHSLIGQLFVAREFIMGNLHRFRKCVYWLDSIGAAGYYDSAEQSDKHIQLEAALQGKKFSTPCMLGKVSSRIYSLLCGDRRVRTDSITMMGDGECSQLTFCAFLRCRSCREKCRMMRLVPERTHQLISHTQASRRGRDIRIRAAQLC